MLYYRLFNVNSCDFIPAFRRNYNSYNKKMFFKEGTSMKKIICVFLLTLNVISLCSCKEEIQEPAQVVAQEEVKDKEISIVALGDNLLHMPVINSGKKEDGTYEYSHLFEKLQPKIKDADISVIGQETVFAGKEFGYSGYPLFNSPSDMGKSLYNEGFDVVLHASNHVMDKTVKGIENTLSFWENYPEITVLGINKNEEEKNEIKIIEVNGKKIAVLNYTYGTNGIPVPKEKDYLVNYIDENKICKDITYSEIKADFTVAFMHWGTEYSMKPDLFQKELAKKMCYWGVDLIIGSHPHVIEPVEWIETPNGNKMLVYYSLGNFVSRQLEAKNLLGAVAEVKLKTDDDKVSIKDYKFIPIVTHYDRAYTKFNVYPLKEYTDELAKEHGINAHDGPVSVERWMKILDDVFEGYDKTIIE